jgi:hypothetical protein
MHRHTTPAVAALEHVFRHAGGELIDQPDLPATRVGVPWRWTATVWPDPARPDGWGFLEWTAGERGWRLPATLVLGDVIEFGVVELDRNDHPIDATTQRWFGWLAELTPLAAIIVGPYHHAQPAALAARPLIDEIRCAQLLTDHTVTPVDRPSS